MKLWMAPGGLHIEPGKTSDAKMLAKIHAEGFFHGWQVSDFVSYLADQHQTPIYVACDARRKIAGFAILRLAGEEAELLTIAVHKKWQGKQIGTALMRATLDDLLKTPARQFFLEVDEQNASALALYQKLGFVKIAERKAYYPRPDGTAATAVVMRATLI